MVKTSARNKGAHPVEPQWREDVLRRERRRVFSDATKWYRLVLFVDLDKLFGRTCVSVFHAISAASLPAREGFRCAPIQTVLCPAHSQARSLVTLPLELLAPKDRRRRVDQTRQSGVLFKSICDGVICGSEGSIRQRLER